MKNGSTILALVVGALGGFILGRELPHGGGSATTVAVPKTLPADWLTEDKFGATEAFKDLTPAQRYAALKVLNEKQCDCGCSFGSIANCKIKDPNCPRAPKVIAEAVALAKQGKTADEILLAVKKPAAAPQRPAEAEGPKRVELAAWTPVKGPKTAKVTILEFSDFQ